VKASRTYTNPVYRSLPDPMALRVGADYYAYGTGPNFPILHSTDLVRWQRAGAAFTPDTFPRWSGGNPWGPSVLAVETTASRPCPGFDLPVGAPCFFMYYTGVNRRLATPSNCIGVATSDRPDGGFKDQGILTNGRTTVRGPVGCGDRAGYSNIDPVPFIDVDGRAYLYFLTGRNRSGAWAPRISVIRLDDDLLHARGRRIPLLSGTQAWEQRGPIRWVEGPWLLRRRSFYYLFYSGGNWRTNYAMGYAVGSSPLGPFRKSRRNPILRGTRRVIGPGGGSVVRGPVTGRDQMVYHGRVRARGLRALRVDRLVWDDTVSPPRVRVNGPTATPQPVP
jgi:beta-xylosidase